MKWLRVYAVIGFVLSAAASLPAFAATVTSFKLPVPLKTLTDLNKDWSLAHEGTPLGVPTGYDWAKKGRLGQGNTVPSGFTAMTGWGQVFRNATSPSVNTPVQMRNFQTYICYGSARTWVQLQQGDVFGGAFRPDFVGNVSQPAALSGTGTQTVGFAADSAFHYWPAQGRATLPGTNICGMVVLMEARVNTAGTSLNGAYLLGFGIDYWQSLTAEWNAQYTTNKDAGVGRLRKVTNAWQWFGLSTASDADLQVLFNKYGVAAPSAPSAPPGLRIN